MEGLSCNQKPKKELLDNREEIKQVEEIKQKPAVETGVFDILEPKVLTREVFESCPELNNISNGKPEKYTEYLHHHAMNSGTIQDLDKEGLHFDMVDEHTPGSLEDIERFKNYVRDNP